MIEQRAWRLLARLLAIGVAIGAAGTLTQKRGAYASAAKHLYVRPTFVRFYDIR